MAKTQRTLILAKCSLAKCGQNFETLILAKCGLAKCGLAKFGFFWPNAVLAKCGLAKCRHKPWNSGMRWRSHGGEFSEVRVLSPVRDASVEGWRSQSPTSSFRHTPQFSARKMCWMLCILISPKTIQIRMHRLINAGSSWPKPNVNGPCMFQ